MDAVKKEETHKCMCGKALTEADPCPLPAGKVCPLLPKR